MAAHFHRDFQPGFYHSGIGTATSQSAANPLRIHREQIQRENDFIVIIGGE